MILTHLVTAVYGQSIWNYQIHVGTIVSIELRTLLSIATLITLFNSIIYQTSIILLGRQTPLEKAGVKIERNKNFNPYKPLLAPLFLSVLIYYCYTNGYYHMNPAMFILFCGLSFAKMTMKLVVCIFFCLIVVCRYFYLIFFLFVTLLIMSFCFPHLPSSSQCTIDCPLHQS